MALPSLHTLVIVDSWDILTKPIRIIFSKKQDFQNIKKVTIPLAAHPILSRLPNVEELVCFGNKVQQNTKPLLKSLQGLYTKERNGEIEPVLKSLIIISVFEEINFTKGT